MNNVIYLLLGWIFGLFSPLIVDKFRKSAQKDELKKGILAELKEVKLRLALSYYILMVRYGSFDRSIIEWTCLQLKEYSGVREIDHYKDLCTKYLETKDEEAAEIFKSFKTDAKIGTALKEYSLPFLNFHIGSLSLFDLKIQGRLFDIRRQLAILNQDVGLARFFYEKTFDPGTMETNAAIINANISTIYLNICKTLRKTVESIEELKTVWG